MYRGPHQDTPGMALVRVKTFIGGHNQHYGIAVSKMRQMLLFTPLTLSRLGDQCQTNFQLLHTLTLTEPRLPLDTSTLWTSIFTQGNRLRRHRS